MIFHANVNAFMMFDFILDVLRNISLHYTNLFPFETFWLLLIFLQDIALDPSLMQRDGIHPTKEAQPLIVDFMEPRLLVAIDF